MSLRLRHLLVACLTALTGLAALDASSEAAPPRGPQTHRISKGQTLGKIAKRYNVTIAAICHASSIERRKPLRLGQQLCIPARNDEGGEKARAWCEKRKAVETPKQQKKAESKTKAQDEVRWHRVYQGQHLGMIARRYNVTVEAIVGANEISKRAPIIPSQQLIIPARDDLDGSQARKLLDAGPPAEREVGKAGKHKSWSRYAKRPKRRHFIEIVGRVGRSWKGTTLTKNGRVRREASKALKRVLATRAGQEIAIDPRLIQLLTRVSDTFGGRRIEITSGYRLGTTSRSSRHRFGRAIDFVVVGVPNRIVCDYVKTFDKVGVGYYPNSHFLHLDVRDQWTHWIDYAGPGQPPRYAGFWTRHSRSQ